MNNFFDAIGIDLGILVVMLMVLVLVLIVLVLNVSLGLHRQRLSGQSQTYWKADLVTCLRFLYPRVALFLKKD